LFPAHDSEPISACTVCGGTAFALVDVLGDALVQQWRLDAYEARYIRRQQGFHCTACRSTMRCMVLAIAIHRLFGWGGTFDAFVRSDEARTLATLEINEAGGLSAAFAKLPRHHIVRYPEVDMLSLPFGDAKFDLVVHSDTLEHVRDPVAGLAECRRVLRPGGACAFTVPMLVGRLTRDRTGLPESFHGTPADGRGYLTYTEFGADAWRFTVAAGFSECRVVALDSPTAHAFVAIR
jgi:SAM-dependent methyltransferase